MNIKNKFVWFRDNFLIFKFAHRIYENKCRNRYRGPKDISILASNCIGGEIYHDLGIPFQSPTINLWMHQDDFFKFINKLDFYLSQNLFFLDGLEKECKHPVARLGGGKMKL